MLAEKLSTVLVRNNIMYYVRVFILASVEI